MDIYEVKGCGECRLCCVFERYTLWDTPRIDRELCRLIREQFPEVRLMDCGGYHIFRMEEGSEGLFPCPVLDPERGCRLGEHRPLDCRIYPFVLARQDDRLLIALSPLCPNTGRDPAPWLTDAARELAPALRSYASRHREMVRPMTDELTPVLWLSESG